MSTFLRPIQHLVIIILLALKAGSPLILRAKLPLACKVILHTLAKMNSPIGYEVDSRSVNMCVCTI